MTAAGNFISAHINVYQKPIKPAATRSVVVAVAVVMWSGEEAAADAAVLTRFQPRKCVRQVKAAEVFFIKSPPTV